MGTELNARGIPTPLPGWSAHALESHPDQVQKIHRDYALAGADVHCTTTFRTHARQFPDTWRTLTGKAVSLARAGLNGFGGRLAGSISPLEDCYRPDLSPTHSRPEHKAMARALSDFGVDLLLVETFSHTGEALVAVQESVETGLPTWLAMSAGPKADLLSPEEIRTACEAAIRLGIQAVLLNCMPAPSMARYLEAIRDLGIPFGAYANSGFADEASGWTPVELDPVEYASIAAGWVRQGATIIGGCCGTGLAHIQSLHSLRSNP